MTSSHTAFRYGPLFTAWGGRSAGLVPTDSRGGRGGPRWLYFSRVVQHVPDRCSSLSLLSPILSSVVRRLTTTLTLGDGALSCFLVTVPSGSLCPSVSCGRGRPVPSRLALDDAIRHKPLNMSSRFSPRVAGESDFLQTVINKVIAAKEVNHKGQGTYSAVLFL